MSEMDDDILKALCGMDTNIHSAVAPVVARESQAEFIYKNINYLPIDVRKRIARVPIVRGILDIYTDCNEGVAISLLNMDDKVLEEMYNFTYFEIKRL